MLHTKPELVCSTQSIPPSAWELSFVCPHHMPLSSCCPELSSARGEWATVPKYLPPTNDTCPQIHSHSSIKYFHHMKRACAVHATVLLSSATCMDVDPDLDRPVQPDAHAWLCRLACIHPSCHRRGTDQVKNTVRAGWFLCFTSHPISACTETRAPFCSPSHTCCCCRRFRPPPLTGSLVGWMKPVFSLPDEQFARVAGIDALTYVRYLWLCFKIAALVTIVSFGALLPTNLTSDAVSKIMRRQARLGCKDTEAPDLGARSFHCLPLSGGQKVSPKFHVSRGKRGCLGWVNVVARWPGLRTRSMSVRMSHVSRAFALLLRRNVYMVAWFDLADGHAACKHFDSSAEDCTCHGVPIRGSGAASPTCLAFPVPGAILGSSFTLLAVSAVCA